MDYIVSISVVWINYIEDTVGEIYMRKNYQALKVVIIGLGITGLSCVKFFLARGVIPKVIDINTCPTKAYQLPHVVQCCLGEFNDTWLFNANLVVVSPGIRLDHPMLVAVANSGIEIIGDIELFVREAMAPIIAITGSNGKSTVTQLVGNMAQLAGWRVGVAGNIGIPVLTLLDKPYQLYVLELSSFQLETTYNLCAAAAVILNISEDHVDRYPGGLQQYYLCKKRIYQNASVCVVNILDALIVSDSEIHNNNCCVTFAIDIDTADYHVKYYQKKNWIIGYNQCLLDCSEMKIDGRVNYMNALSALALSDIMQIPRSASLMALRQFSGLSHRCQLVYENHGISWINDSKATNVNATKEAIENLTILSGSTLHLLLGGDSKQADFSALKNLIRNREIHIYCFGKDGLFLTKLGFNNIVLTHTMQEAMYIISRRVKNKDIVLLSPACSSLDQFVSFKARGLIFNYFAREFG